MQKWHKKLALAIIDIARVNAYVTKCMVDESDKSLRNQHRQFMIDLASELISGKWKETAEDDGLLFADDILQVVFTVDYQFTKGRIAIRRTVRLHFVEDQVSKWDARQTWMQGVHVRGKAVDDEDSLLQSTQHLRLHGALSTSRAPLQRHLPSL